jgi:glycosyltransferase involved in cell wall biosynthesis
VFRGFVDDLRQEFQNARVALVPEEIGGGFKLKTLDYIFSRVPVAAVDAALNGVPTQLKSEFIVESSIGELLTAIVAGIDDIDRLNMMQNRAFELAEDLFNWDANGRPLLDALEFIADDRSKQRPLKSAHR